MKHPHLPEDQLLRIIDEEPGITIADYRSFLHELYDDPVELPVPKPTLKDVVAEYVKTEKEKVVKPNNIYWISMKYQNERVKTFTEEEVKIIIAELWHRPCKAVAGILAMNETALRSRMSKWRNSGYIVPKGLNNESKPHSYKNVAA